MTAQLTVGLAATAAAAHAAGADSADGPEVLAERLAPLRRALAAPTPPDLAEWARAIDVAGGAFPLLGTGHRAETYPALLWNGTRLGRAGTSADEAVVLAGLAAGLTAGSDAAQLARALCAADALSAVLRTASPAITVSRPTTAVLAAATCVALLGGASTAELVRVLDTAASLMVLTPAAPVDGRDDLAPLWTGHACAAGWLAAQLPGTGVTAMPGALAHTLAVAAGSSPTPAQTAGGPSVAELLGELG